MSKPISLVFVPGGWHKPSCFNKTISILENRHAIKCIAVDLPSTQDNPQATYKDDIDAARTAISAELQLERDVIVISHSYGGLIGSTAIKDLTPPDNVTTDRLGFVKGFILIASGFATNGMGFMDPFFGYPLPFFRINKESGYAELTADPREFFYHDVPEDEVQTYVNNISTQSLKALFEGGHHSYAGWKDVPLGNIWYIGTMQDRGLPVIAQRLIVGIARGEGFIVNHVELDSSHSPFISMPEETVEILLDAVQTVSGEVGKTSAIEAANSMEMNRMVNLSPWARPNSPWSWLQYGIPLSLGRIIGWSVFSFAKLKTLWH